MAATVDETLIRRKPRRGRRRVRPPLDRHPAQPCAEAADPRAARDHGRWKTSTTRRSSPPASTCGWAPWPGGCAPASCPARTRRWRTSSPSVFMHEIDLTEGAVLETGCVYIVPLLERAEFSARISGTANPKSSTGRIDVFTRLITDRAQVLRPDRGRLSRAALCRDQPADLPRPGAQGLAAQPAAHPPRLAAIHRHATAAPARADAAGRWRAGYRQRAGALHRPQGP